MLPFIFTKEIKNFTDISIETGIFQRVGKYMIKSNNTHREKHLIKKSASFVDG